MKMTLKEHGFTLLELVITLAIVAIIVVIAVTSANKFLPKYRLKNATSLILSDLNQARKLAAKNGSNCTIRIDSSGEYYDLISNSTTIFQRNFKTDYGWKDITISSAQNPTFKPCGEIIDRATITISNTVNESISITMSVTGRIYVE